MPKVNLFSDEQIDDATLVKVPGFKADASDTTQAEQEILVPRPAPAQPASNTLDSISGFELQDFNRVRQNAPAEFQELQNIGGALGKGLQEDAGGMIQRLGKEQWKEFVGAPRAVLDMLGLVDAKNMADPLNTVEAGRNAIESITDIVKDPRKQLVDNPIMSTLGLLGLRSTGKTISNFGKEAVAPSILKNVDVVDLVDPTDVKVMPLYEKAAKAIGSRMSQSLGTGGKAGELAVDVGMTERPSLFRTSTRRKAFKTTKKGVADQEVARIAGEVADAIEEAEDFKTLRFQEDTKLLRLRDESKPIDPSYVKRSFQEMLKEKPYNLKLYVNDEGGITIDPHDGIFANSSGGLTEEGKRLQEAVNVLWKWEDNSIDGSHTLQRRLDKVIEKGVESQKFADSNRLLVNIRKNLTEHLGDRVEGYAERAKNYADASKFLKLARKAFGLTDRNSGLDEVGIVSQVPVIDEKVLTRVGQLLNDRLNNNLGTRRQVVEELNRIVEASRLKTLGVDVRDMDGFQISEEAARRGVQSTFMDELAGVRFSEQTQGGFVGAMNLKSMGAGTATGALAMYANMPPAVALASSAAMSVLSHFTIKNPRAVGSLLLSLGANARRATEITKGFQEAASFATRVGLPSSAALGVVMRKMYEKDRKKYRETMKQMGAPSSKNPLDTLFMQTPGGGSLPQ